MGGAECFYSTYVELQQGHTQVYISDDRDAMKFLTSILINGKMTLYVVLFGVWCDILWIKYSSFAVST